MRPVWRQVRRRPDQQAQAGRSRSSDGSAKAEDVMMADKDPGSYVVLNGQRLELKKHPTDFSVLADPEQVRDKPNVEGAARLSRHMARATAESARVRDRAMAEVRRTEVAHHIYQVEGTGEEIIIDDRIILELQRDDPGTLQAIMDEYKLEYVRPLAGAHVLRVTKETGRNPIRTANELAQRPEVLSCMPEVVVEIERHDPVLFPEQWYLTTDLISHPDVVPGAGIDIAEAWQITTGDPDVVVGVIDDGFDLDHPNLQGVRLHPSRFDFQGADQDPLPDSDDYHGTPVASIAVGSHGNGAMRGVAPGCSFLPMRIGFGPSARPIDILDVFRFASEHADVVNCSFGTSPRSFDPFSRAFRRAMTQLTETGGRRGAGLVMVFSAANDDAPTFLDGAQNVNGVRFTSGSSISQIPAGRSVFSGYPMTPGVVVVGAMTSRKRKAGYSSWGPHLTVTAPSNNLHYIPTFTPPGTPGREDFIADYRGLGQVAAINRPGFGSPFRPIARFDNPATTDLREDFYTRQFGGTSGAAPIVTGVAALMISVNPHLGATEVRQILMSTADQDLDPTLDLANDPNVQGIPGAFVNGRSLFFGAGKVNAARAVTRARALNPDLPAPGAIKTFHGEQRPDLAIPDSRTAGVVSEIDCPIAGRLSEISVAVDITHTYRGDLRILLTSPGGLVAELKKVDRGDPANDVKETYTPATTADLARMVQAGIEAGGRWRLNVADHLSRDVGRLGSWMLDLRVA
jgi:subtilisin family serine protease